MVQETARDQFHQTSEEKETIISVLPVSHIINTGNFYFDPLAITINVGDTVAWINDGGYHQIDGNYDKINSLDFNNPVNFVGGASNSPLLYTYIFTIPGQYNYNCGVGNHASNGMVGSLTVESQLLCGCTDTTACNYDTNATCDDGSCSYITTSNTDITACNNYTWGSVTYTSSDTYSNVYTGSNGCDSTATLNLTINNSIASSQNVDECDSYTWNGTTYNTSGVYTWVGTNILGCDSTATLNLTIDNSAANCNTCSGPPITGLSVSDIIHDRATFNFDNMNSYDASSNQICRVYQIRIRYRPVGASSWSQKNLGDPTGESGSTGLCTGPGTKTEKITRNLTPSTEYEWEVKVWYCDGQNTGFVSGPNFTTAVECPNVGNFAVTTPKPTRATFTWDGPENGTYSFVRMKAIVDSISNPSATDFFLIGGVGVNYGTYTKNKNGLVPGERYRGQARTWCDSTGGPYRAPAWTPLIYWTQPTQ